MIQGKLILYAAIVLAVPAADATAQDATADSSYNKIEQVDARVYETQTGPEMTGLERPVVPKSKSAGYTITFVPGLLLHGMGNIYAGRTKTGLILMGVEFASIGLLIGGAFSSFWDEPTTAENLLMYGGIAGFIITWIYDIATVGPAIEEFNNSLAPVEMSLSDGFLKVGVRF